MTSFLSKALLLFLALLAVPSFGGYHRVDQPLAPPSGSQQVYPELQIITAPVATSTTRILNANAGPTSAAAKTVTTFAAQPDVPRNLTVTSGGTTTDVESCVITATGTDVYGRTITETFTFSADEAATKTGSKAFRTVTSVAWPASCESGGFAATWSVGVGAKLGLNRCLDAAGYVAFATLNGVYETTRPTVAASATTVSSNTVSLNSSLNGTDVGVLYFQNNRCLP
jgi:hypothetical protein